MGRRTTDERGGEEKDFKKETDKGKHEGDQELEQGQKGRGQKRIKMHSEHIQTPHDTCSH